MQTRVQKEELIAATVEKITASKALVFVDFKGLSVKNMTELKKSLRVSGSSLSVLKKTLLHRAFDVAKVSVNGRELEGQVAVAFSPDEVSAAKAVAEFAKSFKEKKIIVGGSLGDKALTAEEVKALAKLPTQDEMRARLANVLQSPISGFVRTLQGNIGGFVRVLQAVSDQKSAV